MKLTNLLSACSLLCAGFASGQGLYNLMPYDDEPVDALPLYWTAGLNLGYDGNPSPTLSDCPGFDSDSAMYVSSFIQGNFVSKTPQTTIDIWGRLGITYYLDEVEQTNSGVGPGPIGSSEDTFYQTVGGLNIVHRVNDRLRFRSRSNVAYEMEPDYESGLATDRRQGQYLSYSTDNSVGYRWTERFGTVSGYRFNGTTWEDADSEDNHSHLFYNEFRYRLSEVTVLTASTRYGFSESDGTNGADSLYFLVGAEHQFSPSTVGVVRAGVQRFSPDGGDDEVSPYLESMIRTQVNEQFSIRGFLHYGVEDRNRNQWIHDCNAVGAAPIYTPARVLYDQRSVLRFGSQASYVISPKLSVFGGFNLVLDDYQSGTYSNNGFDGGGPWAIGDSAPDLDEAILNINLGASLQVMENVFVTGTYNFSNSDSDADIRDYDRQRVQLGVQTSF